MPDLTKSFDSPYLKAGLNVKQGDNVRFLDCGKEELDKKDPTKTNWVFNVAVVRNGEAIAQKLFQLNKTNFKAVARMYGVNSDNWIKKEMRAMIVQVQNPSGEFGPGVRLAAPGVPGEVEEIDIDG